MSTETGIVSVFLFFVAVLIGFFSFFRLPAVEMSRAPNPVYGYGVPRAYYYDAELQDLQDNGIDPLQQDGA